VDIAKTTHAVNWPGLAYSAQQLLKTRGTLAPVASPLSYAHVLIIKYIYCGITKYLINMGKLPT